MIPIEIFSILSLIPMILIVGIFMSIFDKDFDGSGFGIFGYFLFGKLKRKIYKE